MQLNWQKNALSRQQVVVPVPLECYAGVQNGLPYLLSGVMPPETLSSALVGVGGR